MIKSHEYILLLDSLLNQIEPFTFLLKLGMATLGDSFTKPHRIHHHIDMRPIYPHKKSAIDKPYIGVCLLIASTEKIGNYNMSAISE